MCVAVLRGCRAACFCEHRQILGPSVHITGAIGEECLREWAEEVGEDVGWALGAAASPTSSRAAGGTAAAVASVSPAGPEAVAVRPPAEVLRRPRDYKPGVMQVGGKRLAHVCANCKVCRA